MTPIPLPTPPDFPIAWEDPSDAAQMWFYNKILYRDPITPLDFALRVQTMCEGLNRAGQTYGMPFVNRARMINSYVYASNLPDLAASELANMMTAAEKKVRAAIETLAVTWQQEWLPEVQAHLAFWESYDLQHADLPALLTHLADTEARLVRLWELHDLAQTPIWLAISTLDDVYQALRPNAPAGEAYQLLVGLDNKTLEGGRELWRLSRAALTMPAVAQVLLATDPADAPARLAATEAGRAFWQQLAGYLQQYGKRNELRYLDRPSWCEEPAPVIKNLQNYLRQPDADPEREQQQLIAQREALLASVRQQLSTVSPEQATQFASVYAAAKTGVILSEDHNYWIDYQSYYYSRRVALAVGQRLVDEGVLDAVNDVFYLTLAELHPLAQVAGLTAAAHTYRGLVAARQRAAQHFATVMPPPVAGTLAPFPILTDPLSLAGIKFFAGMPVPPSPTPDELRGTPASAGTARGRAKVALTLADINKIEPGDVLVTPVTSPPWTPLFASVAAVVTETGGILSHAAVVAREYHLPAVVSVQGATVLITDGQWLEVDGAAGIVRLLPAA
jgi:pyruvate,water dikinase